MTNNDKRKLVVGVDGSNLEFVSVHKNLVISINEAEEPKADLGLHVWDDILGLYFSDEDRTKVEWAIGSVLSGGPKKMLLVTGAPATGKSTTFGIIQKILTENWPSDIPDGDVQIRHNGYKNVVPGKYTFVADLSTPYVDENTILVSTSGETIPRENYDTLVKTATEAHALIAQQCIHMYRELGATYYDIQETSK